MCIFSLNSFVLLIRPPLLWQKQPLKHPHTYPTVLLTRIRQSRHKDTQSSPRPLGHDPTAAAEIAYTISHNIINHITGERCLGGKVSIPKEMDDLYHLGAILQEKFPFRKNWMLDTKNTKVKARFLWSSYNVCLKTWSQFQIKWASLAFICFNNIH